MCICSAGLKSCPKISAVPMGLELGISLTSVCDSQTETKGLSATGYGKKVEEQQLSPVGTTYW
jgi:hypothetical protein